MTAFMKVSAVVLAGLLLGVALAEMLLEPWSATAIPFENVLYPYVGFRPPSNTTWRSTAPSPSSRSGDFAIAYTNADGLRIPSPDYPLHKTKPPDRVRIAVLGGSTVHVGTRFSATLPGALQRVIATRFPGADFEVLNGGIISAISGQELAFLLTTLVDYDLDIVVTYDGINDSGQMLYYEKRPNFPYNFQVMEHAWAEYAEDRRAPVWKLILGRSSILQRLWPDSFGERAILERATASSLIADDELRRSYARTHSGNWEKIAKVCRAYEIEPYFVLQPTSLYALFGDGEDRAPPQGEPHRTLYSNYLVYEELRRAASQFADSHPDVGYLDLSSMLPADAFYDGAHVYDDVNDTIAERLADLLGPALEVFSTASRRQFRASPKRMSSM